MQMEDGKSVHSCVTLVLCYYPKYKCHRKFFPSVADVNKHMTLTVRRQLLLACDGADVWRSAVGNCWSASGKRSQEIALAEVRDMGLFSPQRMVQRKQVYTETGQMISGELSVRLV
jgi:hypothetical protein